MAHYRVAAPLQTPPYTHDDKRPTKGRPPHIETGISTSIALQVQMTPPDTPGSPPSFTQSPRESVLFQDYLRAFYPFDPSADLANSDDSPLILTSIRPGDLILVHSVHANGWADGTVLTSGERGWLPTNYCEAYDHPYLRNLLNAMTQFWDLFGADENSNLSRFVRQDYIRGLIAGVRYLLEHAACLHRDATLVQQHTGIRRMRKGLLGDLSTLVHISKSLQENIAEPFSGEVIPYLLDDLMTKAYKVVTRAVGFVDIWSKQADENKVAISGQTGVCAPRMLPRTTSSLIIDTGVPRQHGLETLVDSAKCGVQASHQSKGSVTHRLPLLQAAHITYSASAAAQLAKAHDACISNLAAILGHNLHSRPSSELVETTERLVTACNEILAIVDEVYSRDTRRLASFQGARNAFRAELRVLVKTIAEVLGCPDFEDSEMLALHDQSDRLVSVGTNLIRTAGDCVARTRSLIEQMGNFQLNAVAPTTISMDPASGPTEVPQALDNVEPGAPTSLEEQPTSKVLPHPPQTPPHATIAIADTPAAESGVNATTKSFHERLHKALPPAPLRGLSETSSSSEASISGATSERHRLSRTAAMSPVRKDSVVQSITGSTDTRCSAIRGSATSAASKASTRATTPDHSKESLSPDSVVQNSFASGSSIRSATTETDIDAEGLLLQKTFANELIFNKDTQIAGGSLQALVEQLTLQDSAPDPQFMTAFYLTFRLFTTPRHFADTLIARFDYIQHSSDVTPVRLRVYNVFKGWLETYWNPEADKDALGDIRYFALHKLKPHLATAGDRLAELTRKVAASYRTGTATGPLVSGVGKTSMSIGVQHLTGHGTPDPIVSRSQLGTLRTATSGGPQCSVLDFDPLELARQFTLITSSIFCGIHAEELLSLGWNKKGTQTARNVRSMCTLNTDLAHVVGASILAPEDAKKRALLIKHWVKVAFHCLELNNYDSVMAIMCSINASVVQRLKRTWELVSRKTKVRLGELNAVIDFSRNYASLRKRLESPVAPCIPFLGIYLTDLTFLDAGNPGTRELPCTTPDQPMVVINFDKYLRMAKVISHLQKFQLPYKLQPISEMQAWMDANLQRMRASNGEMVGEFHRRSLFVEPKRVDIRPPMPDGRTSVDAPKMEERPKKERLEMFKLKNNFISAGVLHE